jgi:hypothetical protein
MSQHLTAGLLIAAIGLAIVAPTAEAHDRGGRYGGGYGYRSYGGYRPQRVVEIHRSSSAVPAFIGFVGGLALGTVLGRSTADHGSYRQGDDYCPPQQADYYYDTYSHERFASLDACRVRYRDGCNHPMIVQRIDGRSGECEGVYSYTSGHWCQHDPDWRGYDQGRSERDWNDGRQDRNYDRDRVYQRDRGDDDQNWNRGDDQGDEDDDSN